MGTSGARKARADVGHGLPVRHIVIQSCIAGTELRFYYHVTAIHS